MPVESRPAVLLVSHHSALASALQSALAPGGVKVKAVSPEGLAPATLDAAKPHSASVLALLDSALPAAQLEPAWSALRSARIPVVLLADTVEEAWLSRLNSGALDDLIPRSPANPHWRLRLDAALRACRRAATAPRDDDPAARLDPLTGVLNRSALLSVLFRETDRAQRLRTPLCLLLLDVDDFGHWNERLGLEVCDGLLRQVGKRSQRLLRSYDLLGRAGKDEFLVILPGCSVIDAVLLAERLRAEVFGRPFHAGQETIRLSACFGISASEGRSPVVVLREAELGLQQAKASGPESIQCFGNRAAARPPVTFFSASSGNELLAW